MTAQPLDIVPDLQAALPLDRVPPVVHRDLYALWLAKRPAGGLPARRAFDPVEMPRLLPWVTLFDVEYEPMRFRVRLVGTGVVEGTGMDNTDRYLDELNCIEHTLARCRQLVETRQPYFHANLPMPWSPNDFRTYTVLGLPLADDGLTVDKILGTLTFV
jgi:hypothetical protein